MRAIMLREFGGPERLVLEQVPDPVVGTGQVLVRVSASGVQFVETQIRAGTMPGPAAMSPGALPWTPGREVAGVVAALGDGVDPELLGRRVAGLTAAGSGGYAELAVLAAPSAHLLPDGLDFADAVSLLGTGRTAAGLVQTTGIGPGDTVLVESAAGAVGVLLLQLARAAGAERVIGLARGEQKLKLVRDFGADTAIDYSEDDWPEQVRAVAPQGVSVVVDGVGGETGRRAFELLAPQGRLVVFGLASGSMTKLDPERVAERGVTVHSYFGPPTGDRSPEAGLRQTREVIAAVAAGRLRPFVGRRFPLAEAAAAHAAITARETVGKTVLIP